MIFALVLILICVFVVSFFVIRYLVLVPSYLRDIADSLLFMRNDKNH